MEYQFFELPTREAVFGSKNWSSKNRGGENLTEANRRETTLVRRIWSFEILRVRIIENPLYQAFVMLSDHSKYEDTLRPLLTLSCSKLIERDF